MYKVYLISTGESDRRYKIGFTRNQVEKRVKQFKTGNSSGFIIHGVFESKWGTKIESTLHRKYMMNRVSGEWFYLDKSDVDGFVDQCKRLHDTFELLTKENSWVIETGRFS